MRKVLKEALDIFAAVDECEPYMEFWTTPDELPIDHARLRDDAPDEIKELFKRVFGDEKGYFEKIDYL